MKKTGSTQLKSGVNDLALEIGTEELPADYIPDLMAQLKANTVSAMQAQCIAFKSIEVYGSPRRLIRRSPDRHPYH